ncbi:MAG TPA: OsmC family peroxiredoxin, partial [Leptospiraceae bacterium]|nr:OsmC family peroxiredoxin [Leptospiraceae bacterium]
MKISLKRLEEPYHFEAENESGNTVHIDASPAIGGLGKGARPMELLLMG